MELEKIKELINNARTAAKTEEFRQFIDRFETFVLLYNQKDKSSKNPEYMMKLHDSYRAFWNDFEKISARFGLTPDTFQAFFENPSNFSPEQWNHIQTVKQQITEGKTKPSFPKKLRKNNKKMRI